MRWIVAGLAAALALSAHLCLADQAPYPYQLSNWSSSSGTIAAGGTAQPIAWKLGLGAKVRCVQNPSAATEDLFLDFSGPASTTSGVSFDLSPGSQPLCIQGLFTWNGTWSVNAATGGHAFIALEGQ